MIAAAIALMAIGSLGVGGAVVLEMKTHEPKWKLMMKIFPWMIAVGAVLLTVSVAGG